MRFLIISIALLSSFYGFANERISAQVHKACQTHYVECLKIIPEQLEKATPSTAAWYRLKTYKLTALWLLNHWEELLDETQVLVENESLPTEFKFLVYLYHAKGKLHVGEEKEGMEYLSKTKSLFDQFNSTISNPMYLVEYGNVMLYEAHRAKQYKQKDIYLPKYRDAKITLLKVRDNFYHYNNPKFQMELYTNLGHTSAVLDRNYKTVEFYSKALFWSKQTANKQQIGVTHYNLARSYRATGQLQLASDEFVNAKKMFEESDAIVAVYDTNLMLIEINQSLQNKEFVSQLIGEVQTALDENKLTHYQAKWFLRLMQQTG